MNTLQKILVPPAEWQAAKSYSLAGVVVLAICAYFTRLTWIGVIVLQCFILLLFWVRYGWQISIAIILLVFMRQNGYFKIPHFGRDDGVASELSVLPGLDSSKSAMVSMDAMNDLWDLLGKDGRKEVWLAMPREKRHGADPGRICFWVALNGATNLGDAKLMASKTEFDWEKVTAFKASLGPDAQALVDTGE